METGSWYLTHTSKFYLLNSFPYPFYQPQNSFEHRVLTRCDFVPIEE